MGPTLFLPYSQKYEPGYLAFREPEFSAYFDDNHVQIPFSKGDMVFFSPALHHGAGTNKSEADRIANLVQVSSAFGKTMETVDRTKMVKILYPILQAKQADGTIDQRTIDTIISMIGDGYSFPTNLDSDPPVGGNAPETAQQMMHRALDSGLSNDQLQQELITYTQRRQA